MWPLYYLETTVMYIKRNMQGEIITVSSLPLDSTSEEINDHSSELQLFLNSDGNSQLQSLEQSDQAMARVLEDVVNLLVDQGTIRFTDLPEAAQQKLLSRREMRGQRKGMELLDDGDDLNI